MATSGSFKTTAYNASDGTRCLVFSWKEVTQSVADNTTKISWELRGGGTSTQQIATRNIKLTIDGKTVYSISGSDTFVWLEKDTLVASGTHTFTHKADGTQTFSAYAEAGIYLWAVNCTGSATFTLDTIARASQPSLVTWPDSTANVGDFGTTFSIHMNRKNDSFTHTVRYAYGNRSGTIATKVGTGTTWAVPLDFMNDIPNATSGSGTIYVDTYSGSTLVGTKWTGFTATVPSSVKPSCTFTLDDVTGIDDIYGSPVKGLSKIKIKVTPTLAYSSPIASYSITANGVKYTTAEATTGFLTTAGDSPVKVTVTDKRGRSGSANYVMKVQDYTKPTISALSVHRCDENGNTDDQGNYVKVDFQANCADMGGKNTEAYTIGYKKSGDSSYTTTALSYSGGYAEGSYTFAADASYSYDVLLTARDRHNTTTRATSASTAFSLMDWHPSGTGVRFGGVAEKENTLQNSLDLQQDGNRFVKSYASGSGTDGYILMARIRHIAAYADSPITFVFSRRLASAPMMVNVRFVSSSSLDPNLGDITYEGQNYGAFITKTAENTWDLYVQKITAYDTIALQDWYTSPYMKKYAIVEFPGTHSTQVPTGLLGYYRATPAKLDSLLDFIYPVGSIYMSYSHVDPSTMFGGTWVRIQNAFLWGCDASGTIGQTGGEKTHTLTINEIPSHTHAATYSHANGAEKNTAWLASGGSAMGYGGSYTGGGAAHNNMPPYVQVSIWRRTA